MNIPFFKQHFYKKGDLPNEFSVCFLSTRFI